MVCRGNSATPLNETVEDKPQEGIARERRRLRPSGNKNLIAPATHGFPSVLRLQIPQLWFGSPRHPNAPIATAQQKVWAALVWGRPDQLSLGNADSLA